MDTIYHHPFLVVVSAPSGTGKTTLCRQLVAKVPHLRFSISHTTRTMRAGEQHGKDYFFIEQDQFHAMVAQKHFLEWANVYGNFYGTSFAEVERAQQDQTDLLVEIDVQGAKQILERVPSACGIFILPPSQQVLEDRLRGRGTDDAATIEKRLAISQHELLQRQHYHYLVINEDIEQAVATMKAIIIAERHHRNRLQLEQHWRGKWLPIHNPQQT